VASFTFLKSELQGELKFQLILGLIADMEQKSSAMKQTLAKGAPCRNYHKQLELILQALNRIQECGGLWMEIPWLGGIKLVKVFFPVILMLGDLKSQDNIAGRYASNHANIGRLTFACNCVPSAAAYPWTECFSLNQDLIHRRSMQALKMTASGQLLDEKYELTDSTEHENDTEDDSTTSAQSQQRSVNEIPTKTQFNTAVEYLQKMAQYPVDNIFHYLDLGGGDNRMYDIFSAAVCDIMHTLKVGIMRYVAIFFLP
jgi:hypothetical protein